MQALLPLIVLAFAATVFVAVMVGRLIARAGFPLPDEATRIGHIDGLRGFTALLVMTSHFVVWIWMIRFHATWSIVPVRMLGVLGSAGVALFFMITGLVFYPRIRGGFGKTSWSKLYVGRLFRLVPMAAFSIAVIALVLVVDRGARPGAADAFAMLEWLFFYGAQPLLGQDDAWKLNAGVLWSLCVEWQFYVFVLPYATIAMDGWRRNARPTWFLPATGLLGFYLLSLLGIRTGSFLLSWYAPYMTFFTAGMLGWEIRQSEKMRTALATPLAGGVAVFGFVGALWFWEGFNDPNPLPLAGFMLFFACVACGNSVGGLLDSTGSRVLGECSFGIYLLHGLVLFALFTWGQPLTALLSNNMLPLLLPGAAAIVIVLTAITYLVIERPGIKAGRWIAGAWGKSARPAAVAMAT